MKLFKSFLLIIILAAVNVEASAQLPDSIAITTDGSWIIQHNETYYGWSPETETYIYTTTTTYNYCRSGGDTLVDDTLYTQLLRIPINRYPEGGFYASPFAEEYYYFGYRNDNNRKAYRVHAGSTTEELWYDFNYSVGDTMWNPNTMGIHSYLVISDIDSTDYCGTNYEQLNFDEIPQTSIQRVGSVINFFQNYSDVFTHDEIVFFCEESVPFAAVAGIEDSEETNLLSLYPNPSNSIVNISTNDNLVPENIILRNVAGEIVYQDNSGATSFSIEDFANGIYFVTVQIADVNYTQRLIKN